MIDELEKQGVLKTIIENACNINEEALAELGRGGKRSYLAFMSSSWKKKGTIKKLQAFDKV